MADADHKEKESKIHVRKCFCNLSSRDLVTSKNYDHIEDSSIFKTWIEDEKKRTKGRSANHNSCKCRSRERKSKKISKETIKSKIVKQKEPMSRSKYDWSSSSFKQTHENGSNGQQAVAERESLLEKELNNSKDSTIHSKNGNKSRRKYCDDIDRPVTDKPRRHACRCSGHKQYKHESFKNDPLQEVLIPCPYREIMKEQIPASKEYVIKEATIIEEVEPTPTKRESIQKEPERYTSHWMEHIDKMENKGIQCMYKQHRRKGYVNHNTIILPGNNATEVITAAMSQGDSSQNCNGVGSLSHEIYKQTQDIHELKKMVATCLVILEGGLRQRKGIEPGEAMDASNQGKKKKKSSCCSKKKKQPTRQNSQRSEDTSAEESADDKTDDQLTDAESSADSSVKSKKTRKKRPSCFMRLCKYCCLTQ